MKGVSSVIAIILILMIVVALAALAYTWFTGIFATLTATTATAVTTTTGAMATSFRIEAAKYGGSVATGVNYTIRNIGTSSFNASKTITYVGGAYSPWGSTTGSGCCIGASCSPGAGCPGGGTLSSGATATFYNVTNATAACPATGGILEVTIETGLTDSRSITC